MAVSCSCSRPAAARMELQSSKQLWRERREASPERTVVWTEPLSSKPRRVPVIYYLSRNGQLEHPHFMEVPLPSSQPLYLRDVVNRLNVLRGKGMASMYSWSSKRNYKNRFVWHDLADDDLIHPAHGNDYVLKGSELLGAAFLDTSSANFQPQQPPTLALPPPETQTEEDDVHCPKTGGRRRRNQSCSSIDFSNNLHEYNVYKADTSGSLASTDASTQTDEKRRRHRRNDEIVEAKNDKETQGTEIEISPPTSDSSAETLETLIKSERRLVLRPEPEYEDPIHRGKDKATATTSPSVLMQLFSCGSISFKDCGTGHGMGLRFPRMGGIVGSGRVKLEEKQYFSGSIVETKKRAIPSLQRSTSYGAERSTHLEVIGGNKKAKCLRRKQKEVGLNGNNANNLCS